MSQPSGPQVQNAIRDMNRPTRTNGAASWRTVLFWFHLTAGVTAGLIVLVMSVTGLLLAYERQVFDWIASRHQVAPVATASRLSLDTLLARGRAATAERPGRSVAALGIRVDTTAAVTVGLDDRSNLFLDPYTGAVLGDDAKPRALFAAVQRWHRWLASGPPAPPRSSVGKAITGACNLAFLFLILSGPFLWWPRQRSKRAFRAVLFFNRGAQGRARDWNWHHVFGIWAVPVLFVIVISATFMSYGWPGALMQRMLDGRAAAPSGEEGGGGRQGQQAPVVVEASFDAMMASAIREVPAWRSIQWRFPRAAKRPVTVTVVTGSAARPDQRIQGTFDAKTGAVKQWQAYSDGSPFRRFRSWIRPIHTGEVGGILGQTIAVLATAAAVMLVWTGLALAWRRCRSWLAQQETDDPGYA